MAVLPIATVDIDGGSIAYLETGTGEPLVYLHGAGGRPPAGATFVAELGRSFRVLLPSRPGFDESPAGRYETPRDAAEAVAAFVNKMAGRSAHVVAQSAGGAVGLWLAVLYPDLVASLVLSAPAAFAHRPASAGPPARGPEELDRILYGDRPSWSSPPDDQEQARIRRNAAFNTQHFAGSNDKLRERLGEIKAPVLVIWGTEDRMVPPENSKLYQEHIPHALRIFVYGAAHELPIAATTKWVALVTDFIQRGEFFVVNKGGRGNTPPPD
ncbi:MAG TPA: alpha/beta hydrolase [Dehalococcoidia bacterium]|nr:alpha/beta hydrolase [Dehalococcoidia bacterium]